jgi:hypothetical protein
LKSNQITSNQSPRRPIRILSDPIVRSRRRARRALDVRSRAIAVLVSPRRRPPRASPTPRDDARGETH